MSINTTLTRSGRALGMAAVIVAASGVLSTTGGPLFGVVGQITLNLAAVQSEAEELRRKGAGRKIAAPLHQTTPMPRGHTASAPT
jgi:hypothetical protein